MNKNKLFKIIGFIFSFIFCQYIPSYSFISDLQNLLFDEGLEWEKLSIFEPIDFQYQDGLKNHYNKVNPYSNSIGINEFYHKKTINGFFSFSSKNQFFCYFYPQLMYSRKKNNLSVKYSGFGYKNKWASVQISKNNEDWGAGNSIELSLSKKSRTFDYISLSSDYGSIRVRYIHGFLEQTNESINRYITGKGIEWTNRKSVVIGFSEMIIYSGYMRSFDIAYLNPISTHLEIELNERLNMPGNHNANAVWQIHSDFYFKEKIRLSANFLIDEFVFDPETQIGKEHGYAYSLKGVYSLIKNINTSITGDISYIIVGTPTFRHGNGFNNFVHGQIPLGNSLGSDFSEFRVGLNYTDRKKYIISVISSLSNVGQESIKHRPLDAYENYQKSSFPSGDVTSTVKNSLSLRSLFYKNILTEIYIDKMRYNGFENYNFSFSLSYLFD